MLPRICITALGAAVAVSAAVAQPVCNADNCLRALRAASPATRLAQAQQDCSAFLVVTVTAPLQTATAYSTISSTETIVNEITTTTSADETLTLTVHETPTETVYTSTVTVTVNGAVPNKKRQASPTIPTYAGACSGAVRFTSACACIGVTGGASTVTLPASTTTVTEPTTTYATVYETSVVATSTIDDCDEIVTETVTEPAVTVSTITTVTTTNVASPTSTFTVELQVEGRSSGYLGKYDSTTLSYGFYTTDPAAALTLNLRPDGSLWYGSKVAKGEVNGNTLAFFFIDPSASTSRKTYTCKVDEQSVLTCEVGTAGNNKFAIQQAASIPLIYSGKPQNLPSTSFQGVTMKVKVA